MHTNSIFTARRLLSILAVSSTLWVAACGTDGPAGASAPAARALPPATEDGAVAQSSAPAPTTAAAKFEVKFMTDMIDHHMMAVMMAETCLAKALHDELRAMCESIVATQTAEIQLMESWLQDWYGVMPEPHMSPGMHHHMDKLAALSGADFEIEFMKMMIRHHRAAVREARHCVEKAYHQELISLCQGMVSTQLAEIQQMEAWLCSWYGRC